MKRNIPKQPFQNISYIDSQVFNKSLNVGLYLIQNNFIEYLYRIFNDEIVVNVSERFNIGTAKIWNGATIFWQVDDKQKVRSGKIILYDKLTKKKVKWILSNSDNTFIRELYAEYKIRKVKVTRQINPKSKNKYKTELIIKNY